MSKKTTNNQPKVTETITKELYDDVSDLSEKVADALIDIAVKHNVSILFVFDFYVSFFTYIVDSVKKKQEEKQEEKAEDVEKTEDKEDNN